MSHINKDINICFLDFETTGANLFEDEPLQIGAVLFDWESNKIKKFASYIRPKLNINSTYTAYDIHHIDIGQLKKEPGPEEVLEKFFKNFGTNYCFAGWNISFDVPFFKKICYENGYQGNLNKIHYRHIDIQSIFRYLKYLNVVDSNLNSMSDYSAYFDVERAQNHDALEDAYISYLLFLEALEILKKEKNKGLLL
jgi:DNA polymerase III epsilon subunit-like protein